MVVTGHRTSRMVTHYTKDANKKRQASAAILKLEKTQVNAEPSETPEWETECETDCQTAEEFKNAK